VIILDPRGQGRSSKDGSQYTYIQQGNDIDKLIKSVDLQPTICPLVAESGLFY
jgi:pimeloyl-ACP methyl ester carboxylesterase